MNEMEQFSENHSFHVVLAQTTSHCKCLSDSG